MNSILIIGAGRSSTALINYVLDQAKIHSWFVTVADANVELAQQKVGDHPFGRATWLDVNKRNDRRELIDRAKVVVSLLPAHLHLEVAHDCIQLKKHLITASYVSKEMYRLGDEARDRELIFMGEMGLDPGIDHMSAKKHIDDIKAKGGVLTSFRSYTGGLMAPDSNDNPWKYKFTWNPRNVVLAGQGTAQYLENGRYKYIPYNRLFSSYKTVNIEGLGEFEMYANRDSLLYRTIYGLEAIPSLLRGTLRYPGFCDAWNALIKIGLTNGSFPILESENLTYHGLLDAFMSSGPQGGTLKERTAAFLGVEPKSRIMKQLTWLGLFSKKKIKVERATPALILEDMLLRKWKLKPEDKDMIVMQHELEYEYKGQNRLLTSTMIMKGKDQNDTAMARLVGLPMGIFVKLLIQGKITATGVNIPVMSEVYNPVLEELKAYGVEFTEKDELIADTRV